MDVANKLIAVDLDGTLCTGKFWLVEPAPIVSMIEAVKRAHKKGAHIVIYTARADEHFRETRAWLRKFGVPYHGICMGDKPGADMYVDDKCVAPTDFCELV